MGSGSLKVTVFFGGFGFVRGSSVGVGMDLGSGSVGRSSIFAFLSSASMIDGFSPDMSSCRASTISASDICASFWLFSSLIR